MLTRGDRVRVLHELNDNQASQLLAARGEVLTVLRVEASSTRAWCCNDYNAEGWVNLDHLAAEGPITSGGHLAQLAAEGPSTSEMETGTTIRAGDVVRVTEDVEWDMDEASLPVSQDEVLTVLTVDHSGGWATCGNEHDSVGRVHLTKLRVETPASDGGVDGEQSREQSDAFSSLGLNNSAEIVNRGVADTGGNLPEESLRYKVMQEYRGAGDNDLDVQIGEIVVRLGSVYEGSPDKIFVEAVSSRRKGFVPVAFLTLVSSWSYDPWFFGRISRDEAEHQLSQPEVVNKGFLVRQSSSVSGYVISFKTVTPGENIYSHRRIIPNGGKFYAWEGQEYYSVDALITAHCSGEGGNRLGVPCPKYPAVPHPPIPPEPPSTPKPKLNQDSNQPQHFIGCGTSNPPKAALPPNARGDGSSDQKKRREELQQACGTQSSKLSADPWHIDCEAIKWKERLGVGNFGEVWRARLTSGRIDVAIKTIKPGSETQLKDFFNEAEVMKLIRHPNLVKLYGVSTSKKEMFLVMELHPLGNVVGYCKTNTLTDAQRLVVIHQTAGGMRYLADSGLVHRDLAARNVLLHRDITPRIADVGLAKMIKDGYRSIGCQLPWKSTAPEVYHSSGRWSSQCDVWSFGIFCWEVYTNCSQIYADRGGKLTKSDLRRYLENGYRLKQPTTCSQALYSLLLECWNMDPAQRPSFKTLEHKLSAMAST